MSDREDGLYVDLIDFILKNAFSERQVQANTEIKPQGNFSSQTSGNNK
jgi:hypothetical protein